jgi:hypothetical protein
MNITVLGAALIVGVVIAAILLIPYFSAGNQSKPPKK